MPKDFGHWLEISFVHFGVKREEKIIAPNLIRSVEELEDELRQRVMRNLHLVDVPRGQGHDEGVMQVLRQKSLADAYAASPVWQHAHQLYWQIEALKGSPDAVMWHPV